jgi:hypothetical protein
MSSREASFLIVLSYSVLLIRQYLIPQIKEAIALRNISSAFE